MRYRFPQLLACLLSATTLLCTVGCMPIGGGGSAAHPTEESPSSQPPESAFEGSTPPSDTQAVTEAETLPPETETEAETEGETKPLPPADFVVTEKNGLATVCTPTGLRYTVTGYAALHKATATFTDGLTYTFPDEVFGEKFNRFTLSYETTEPLRIRIAYTQRGRAVETEYFLDAGEGSFSGLVDNFLRSVKGQQITAMRVETCTGKPADFTLSGMTTQVMEVPSASLYLENRRFKLGIDLGWGGTVNYLEDKSCPIPGVTNLVNRYDTGRLIQQSYYGTNGVPGQYEPGVSFDSHWAYNPVQGGDQYNNPSRLVDLVITEQSVYIKTQPRDWSLNNQLTPSYMESTYTLERDHIRVDNRFTDYSGWEHPFRDQELPALYTISYLDKFVWYGGSKPWTGDTLSARDDLGFWGGVPGSTAYMREDNTETWCAWVSSRENYGIGLYVPNVDQLKAGRYEYDGSQSDRAPSTNYVAPINVLQMVSFSPITYSYMLTAGTTESIRATFTKHKDFADNISLHEHYQSTRLPQEP